METLHAKVMDGLEDAKSPARMNDPVMSKADKEQRKIYVRLARKTPLKERERDRWGDCNQFRCPACLRATPSGCVECLMCGSEFITELPADMPFGGVPHPTASTTKKTEVKTENPSAGEVPHLLTGLMREKVVPFRGGNTEKIPAFYPDVTRGTFDDVYEIEHMYWGNRAERNMSKKYQGMEKEAVRDWQLHVRHFLSMRLRFLRQASSYLTVTTTPPELGTAMSFSYDQRLGEPTRSRCPAYYGKSEAEWRTMWTGGPLEALFFTMATGSFRTRAYDEYKKEYFPPDVVTCMEIGQLERGAGNWCPLFANGIFIRAMYEIRVDFTDKIKAPNATGAYAVIRGRSARLHAIHLQMKSVSELEGQDYYQVDQA